MCKKKERKEKTRNAFYTTTTTAPDSKNCNATSEVRPMQSAMDEYAAVCKCRAEFGRLSELTVPVGVGKTNGVVGVPELELELEDEDTDECVA